MIASNVAGFTKKFSHALDSPAVWRGIDIVLGVITLGIGLHLLFFE